MGCCGSVVVYLALDIEKREFYASLKKTSKTYQGLALEIIFLCRFFVQAHEQNTNYSVQLKKWCLFAFTFVMPHSNDLSLEKGC